MAISALLALLWIADAVSEALAHAVLAFFGHVDIHSSWTLADVHGVMLHGVADPRGRMPTEVVDLLCDVLRFTVCI